MEEAKSGSPIKVFSVGQNDLEDGSAKSRSRQWKMEALQKIETDGRRIPYAFARTQGQPLRV